MFQIRKILDNELAAGLPHILPILNLGMSAKIVFEISKIAKDVLCSTVSVEEGCRMFEGAVLPLCAMALVVNIFAKIDQMYHHYNKDPNWLVKRIQKMDYDIKS